MSEYAPEAGADVGVADDGAAPEAAEPAWAGITQEQWEQSQAQQAAIAQYIQQQQYAQQQAQQANQPLQFDPWSDDPTAQLNAIIQSHLAPLQQTYQRIEDAEGQELARDVVADFVSREGEFLSPGGQDLAIQLASGPNSPFLREAIQRYGYGDRAGEAAIEAACKHVRQLEDAAGQAYHERQTNQLATLAGARGEPGSSGSASQVSNGQYRVNQSVTDKFFGRG